MTTTIHRFGTFCCLLALMIFAACSSRKDDPQAVTGMSWSADSISATEVAPQVANSSTNIDIIASTGTKPNTTTLHLGMPAQTDSYAIDNTYVVTADYVTRGGASNINYLASNGTITISTFTPTRAAGNFSFTAYNYSNGLGSPHVKTITNGRFDVPR